MTNKRLTEVTQTFFVEVINLRCDNCGDIVEVCGKCRKDFYADDKVICEVDDNDSSIHYHIRCGTK